MQRSPVFLMLGLFVTVAISAGQALPRVGADPPPATATAKRIPVGKNIWLEIQGKSRRVVLEAAVCLREGQLEEFLCRKFTKEHESILAADLDARDLHAALLLTGIQAGSPTQFQPEYKPATGPKIRVTLQYVLAGKAMSEPAQKWVRNARTKKQMELDWVFGGSNWLRILVHDLRPLPWYCGSLGEMLAWASNTSLNAQIPPPPYLANSGDLISVSNFESSLLDLPVRSTDEDANLSYEAFTSRIPPLDTKITVILEPIPDSLPGSR